MKKTISDLSAVVENGAVVLDWAGALLLRENGAGDEFSRFRIYRQEEPDYTSNYDGPEFFLGVTGEKAQLIFEGEIVSPNGVRYRYTDRDVQPSTTYSYFVQTRNSERIGPIPVMVRDPEIWWSYDYYRQRLTQLAAHWPDLARWYGHGRTVAGREIPVLEVGRGSRILGLVGLAHAGESGPEMILPALETLLETRPALFQRVKVVAMLAQNIDSREQMIRGVPWYIRKNWAGVDLNRNFPASWELVDYRYGGDSSQPDSETYRGAFPGSEPETQALLSLFAAQRPEIVLNYHWLSGISGLPALATSKGQEDTEFVRKCRRVTEIYGAGLFPDGEGLRPEFKDPESWLKFPPAGGTLGSWFYDLGGIPGLTIEGGLTEGGMRARRNLTDRALLHEYQQRHARALARLIEAWFAV